MFGIVRTENNLSFFCSAIHRPEHFVDPSATARTLNKKSGMHVSWSSSVVDGGQVRTIFIRVGLFVAFQDCLLTINFFGLQPKPVCRVGRGFEP